MFVNFISLAAIVFGIALFKVAWRRAHTEARAMWMEYTWQRAAKVVGACFVVAAANMIWVFGLMMVGMRIIAQFAV